MRLQYTTDCALRMMVYVAGENRIVSSRELEEKIGFPQQCIFSAGRKLKKAGYINTISGPFGGYILSRSPKEITIQDILVVFKDSLSVCCEKAPVKRSNTTAMNNYVKMTEKLEADIRKRLSECTLAHLLHKNINF